MKELAECYKGHYWALMEELKAKHKEYYWEFGKSPYSLENTTEGTGENNNNNNGGRGTKEEEEEEPERKRCEVNGCKGNAMALTRFCHSHILSDSEQTLYKGCGYCIKSTQTGPILCLKPVLRSSVPPLCSTHLPYAEKLLAKALKKEDSNLSLTRKIAPKFHILVSEYIRAIQTKRRAAARKATVAKVRIDEQIR